MPDKYDNRPVNKELHNLIINRGLSSIAREEMFESLILSGANPFATFLAANGNPVNLFQEALYLEKDDIVEWMLAHSVQTGNPMDLSEPCPFEPKSSAPMSWMHYAIFRSDTDCVNKLKAHQDKYHPDNSFEGIINREFYYHFRRQKKVIKTTTWSILLWTITLKTFLNDFTALGKGADQASAFILEWMDLAVGKKLKQELDERVILLLLGQISMMQFLLANGLQLDETTIDHNRQTIRNLLDRLNKAANDPQLWNIDIKPNLDEPDNVELGIARQGNGGILVPTTIKNLFGAHPITPRVTPKFKKITNIMLAALEIQNKARLKAGVTGGVQVKQLQRTVANHTKQIGGLEKRVTKLEIDFADFGRKLNALAKVQRNEIKRGLARDTFYLNMFEELYKSTESLLRQTSDKKLGVFQVQPKLRDVAARSLIEVFSIAAVAACPIPNLVNGIQLLVSGLYEWRRGVNESMVTDAVFKNTLSVEAEDLATYLATFLTAEAMKAHGKNANHTFKTPDLKDQASFVAKIFAQVKAQINTMSHVTEHDPIDLICHLGAKAVPTLKAIRSASDPISGEVIRFSPHKKKDSPRKVSGGSDSTPTDDTEIPLLRLGNGSGSNHSDRSVKRIPTPPRAGSDHSDRSVRRTPTPPETTQVPFPAKQLHAEGKKQLVRTTTAPMELPKAAKKPSMCTIM